MLSRIGFTTWGKSASYPSYVKWKNQPFAVLLSPINGLGLFTDSSHGFNAGDTIGYAFFKQGSTGKFDVDYVETNIGSFINNSTSPNVDVSITTKGILMLAKQSIGVNTELTASYQALINLFPNDQTVKKSIRYW